MDIKTGSGYLQVSKSLCGWFDPNLYNCPSNCLLLVLFCKHVSLILVQLGKDTFYLWLCRQTYYGKGPFR